MAGKKSNKKVKEGDEEEDDTITLTDTQKAIFWSIIKETDGGKFHKILSEGPSTNAQKTKVWKQVGEILERETGVKMSSKKLRGLHQRQKAKLRKDHDKMLELSRTFNKECRKTGSGPGPMPPSEMDGDAIDEMDINDYDPLDMAYNSLTKTAPPPSSGDRGLNAGGSSSKAFLKDRPSLVGQSEIFRQPNSASTVNHRPLVDGISVWKSPFNKNSTAHPNIVALEKSRNYLPNFSSFASPNSASSNSPSSSAASPSFMSPTVTNPTETIQSFIDIDDNGQLTVGGEDLHFYTPGLQEVTVETTPRANLPKKKHTDFLSKPTQSDFLSKPTQSDFLSKQKPTSSHTPSRKKEENKKSTAKNDTDAASKYYAEMLKLQRGFMKDRRNLIQQKIRTEKLKQTLLQSKLSENNLPLPDMESQESDSEEASEEDDDEEY